MDRVYLDKLYETDQQKFLEELTPNPNHDGTSMGLDLSKAHHKKLRQAYQSKVVEVCKRLGKIDHPALKGLKVRLNAFARFFKRPQTQVNQVRLKMRTLC